MPLLAKIKHNFVAQLYSYDMNDARIGEVSVII